ncbi:MAG: pyridoxamine 5'-phosphate oxidase family protein [Deltaproteobacteria bacterium]|nr:pyridoxamine 5'-phosphate oxidase family protein [Deltaproteobacteria bacterium]
MFREIRRKEKQLTIEECNKILTKAEYGTLATMGSDGYPYAVAVNYIFYNGSIYFHCALVGHKLDNIANCKNVSFNIVTDVRVVPIISDNDIGFDGFDTNFNSVVIFGKAMEVVGKEKSEVLIAFLKKFLDISQCRQYETDGIRYVERSMKKTTLMKIEIEQMTGKRGISKNKDILGKQH